MNIDVLYIAIVIVVVLLSMTIHEAMHAYMGYWLGDDTAKAMGRLSLNPIKHIDPFLTVLLPVMLAIAGLPIFGGAKPVPFNPQNVRGGEWGAALVALAGPLTNFVLAFLSFGVLALMGSSNQVIGREILGTAVTVNLGFFIFNMVPIPPLDGSRVLYALAPEFVRRGMEAMERYGIIVVFALILLAGPSLAVFMGSSMNFFIGVFSQIFHV